MSSSVSTTAGGVVVVVTHVHPVPQNGENGGQQHYVGINMFSKGRPLELGTIQIMVGLMFLVFGIVMAIHGDTLGVFSGIFVWGALMYITAGGLTVAAGKYLTHCLVNGSLGACIVAAVFSLTGTILYSLDAAGVFRYCSDNPDYYPSYSSMCYTYWIRTQGFSGVLAIFSLLEFIVSVTVAAFAGKATCNCYNTPPLVIGHGGASVIMPTPQPLGVPVAQHTPSQVQVNYPKNPQEAEATGFIEPPAYTTVVS